MDSFTKTLGQIGNRSQRLVREWQERLGQADDITELPPDYLELEKQCDALKTSHQKMLSVTSNYANEGYDYPPNLRESIVDLSKNISEKVQGLASAHTAQQAQDAITGPSSKPAAPKTLSHAIGRAAVAGVEVLPKDDPYGKALGKYALAEEKIGEARLTQDHMVVSRFNQTYNTTLHTSLASASQARKKAASARLELDSAKARAKNAQPEYQDARRVEVEQAEDLFVAETEEAVGVMKNILDTPEPLRGLADLIAAQLEYHKKAFEILSELAPEIDAMQVEHEEKYREKRYQ